MAFFFFPRSVPKPVRNLYLFLGAHFPAMLAVVPPLEPAPELFVPPDGTTTSGGGEEPSMGEFLQAVVTSGASVGALAITKNQNRWFR